MGIIEQKVNKYLQQYRCHYAILPFLSSDFSQLSFTQAELFKSPIKDAPRKYICCSASVESKAWK